jgi:hypothetical protein
MEERLAQRLGELDMAIRRTRADNRLGLESLRDVGEGVRRLEARLDQVVTSLAAAAAQHESQSASNGSADPRKKPAGAPRGDAAEADRASGAVEATELPPQWSSEMSTPEQARTTIAKLAASSRDLGLAVTEKRLAVDTRKVASQADLHRPARDAEQGSGTGCLRVADDWDAGAVQRREGAGGHFRWLIAAGPVAAYTFESLPELLACLLI